jgi:hypothetical protein
MQHATVPTRAFGRPRGLSGRCKVARLGEVAPEQQPASVGHGEYRLDDVILKLPGEAADLRRRRLSASDDRRLLAQCVGQLQMCEDSALAAAYERESGSQLENQDFSADRSRGSPADEPRYRSL